MRTRLGIALERRYITTEQFDEPDAIFEAVGKMATRLIQYLERSNRPRRGLTGPPVDGTTNDDPTDRAPTPDDPPVD